MKGNDMDHIRIAEKVNNVSTSYGRNGYTREEWLWTILESGQITRIGQHLALVIYHLSDKQTNTAELSARDLERITGWTKTAIMDHLSELEIFIRVRFGRGRAKHLFELQGVISEAIDDMRSGRQIATTYGNEVAAKNSGSDATTIAATTIATTQSGSQTATTVATIVAKTEVCGSDVATNDVMGGTIGGEIKTNVVPYNLSQGSARDDIEAQPRPWMIDADGYFLGQVFEVSPIELVGMRTTYSYLEFPAELVSADKSLAAEWGSNRPDETERNARLHSWLNAQNRKAAALTKAALAGVSADRYEDCHYDDHQIVVANGFKAQLLAKVGGNEKRLQDTLDKITSKVPAALRGKELRRVVLGEFTKQAQWDDNDERRTKAVENRVVGKPKASLDDQAAMLRAMGSRGRT